MSTPNYMPRLSRGSHSDPSQGACAMEYVSFLAGEKFTDSPTCTDPLLSAFMRDVNDTLPDSERHRLIPLITMVIDTTAPHRSKFHSGHVAEYGALVRRLSADIARTQTAFCFDEHGRWMRARTGEILGPDTTATAIAIRLVSSLKLLIIHWRVMLGMQTPPTPPSDRELHRMRQLTAV